MSNPRSKRWARRAKLAAAGLLLVTHTAAAQAPPRLSTAPIEGHGTRTSGANIGTVSHDGLVTVYRDATGRLRWNGPGASSGPIDAEITLGPHGLEWCFVVDPQGTRIRFIITLDANEWRETGDLGDGTSWTRSMDMTLHRAAAR